MPGRPPPTWRWCGTDWRARFDAVADDLRAALAWAADRPEQRADAYDLARHLAELTFTRNLIGESQQRYEQAAALADDPAAAASMLRHAAAVAGCRMRGDDMYRLHRAAADAARQAGDTAGAAYDLATAATSAYRFSSKFVRTLPPEEAIALIAEARELAGDDPAAGAAVALAEAGVLTDAFGAAQGPSDAAVPEAHRARRTGGRPRPPHRRPARRVRGARHAHRRPELGRRHVRRRGHDAAAGWRCSSPRRTLRPAPTS